jgi:hypothetical protein
MGIEKVDGGIMQEASERTASSSAPAPGKGDDLRLQAESCRRLACSALTARNRAFWLRLVGEWLDLAERAEGRAPPRE